MDKNQEIQIFNEIKENIYNKLGIPLKSSMNTLVIISGLFLCLNLLFIVIKYMKDQKIGAVIFFLLYSMLLYCIIETSIKLKKIKNINDEIKVYINSINLNEYHSLLDFIKTYSTVSNVRKNVIIILFVYIVLVSLIFMFLQT